MPVLNEQRYLADAVASVLSQRYDGECELILALGPSTDRTDEIAADLAARDARVRLVRNPVAHIANGLNAAILAARFEVIVRVDAHSELEPGYTSTAVASLESSGAANVGGIMHAQGVGGVQRAIAHAYNSRFGLGGGQYHRDGEAGPAESAYLGVFRKQAVLDVGLFDTSLLRGEDWELNFRLRAVGYVVWFDPALRVTYWPRSSLGALAKQMFATGAWRAIIVRRLGQQNPLRFFVPGALVLALFASVVVAGLQLTGIVTGVWSGLLSLVYLAPASYLLVNLLMSVRARTLTVRERGLLACSFATMHVCWGAGFLRGLLFGARGAVDRSRLGRQV